METPHVVVIIIEAANHDTVDEPLNCVALGTIIIVGRHRLSGLALLRSDAHRNILKDIPHDRAERTGMGKCHVALTLDVADECERLLRRRVVINAEVTALLAIEKCLESSPGGVRGRKGGKDGHCVRLKVGNE